MKELLPLATVLAPLALALIVGAGIGSASIEFGSFKVSGLNWKQRLFLGGLGGIAAVIVAVIIYPIVRPKAVAGPASATTPAVTQATTSKPMQAPPPPATVAQAVSREPSKPTAQRKAALAAVPMPDRAIAARDAPTSVPVPEAEIAPAPVAAKPVAARFDWLKLRNVMERQVSCLPKKCASHVWLYINDYSLDTLYSAEKVMLAPNSRNTFKIVPRSTDDGMEFVNSCSGSFDVGGEPVWKEFRASFKSAGRVGQVERFEIHSCELVDQ